MPILPRQAADTTNCVDTISNCRWASKCLIIQAKASWRQSDQSCALALAGVRARGEEDGSRVLDVARLGTSAVLAHIKALLWAGTSAS